MPSLFSRFRLPLLLLLLLSAALGTTVWFLFSAEESRPRSLTLLHTFENPLWSAGLETEIMEFQKLFPRARVKVEYVDSRDFQSRLSQKDWDVVIGPEQVLSVRDDLLSPPQGFTGSLWGLYYHKKTLDDLRINPAELTTWEALERAFETLSAAKITPVSVGSQYGWPLAVWVQALAAPQNWDAAVNLGTGTGTLEGLQAEIKRLQSWASKNWLSPNHKTRDWPQSLQEVVKGQGGFCLMNEQFVQSLRPQERAALGYLPFPGTLTPEGTTRWAMGSLVALGVRAETPEPVDTGHLVSYLNSPGAANRLSARIGAPFFAQGQGPQKLLSSVAGLGDSEIVRELMRNF